MSLVLSSAARNFHCLNATPRENGFYRTPLFDIRNISPHRENAGARARSYENGANRAKSARVYVTIIRSVSIAVVHRLVHASPPLKTDSY